ncbi:hypothetical protein BJX99DRAFT_250981 [Aspergillus californicus]
MAVVTAEQVAIAELAVYIPIAFVTIWVVFRHGFHKQLGWIYLSIFSVVRIAGAIMQIESHNHPDNSSDKEWATILQSVGLSPLLLATLGLLKRVFDEVTSRVASSSTGQTMQTLAASSGILGKFFGIYSKRATATSRRSRVVQLLHLPALISLILAISGGTDQASSSPSDQKSGKSETRAAIIIFLVIYIAACLLWMITIRDLPSMVSAQKRIFFTVFLALPFIAVRMLYSLIADFGHNDKFSFVNGDATIQLVMATIEEFVVVVVYTVAGVLTPKSKPGSGKENVQPLQPVPGSQPGEQGYYGQVPYAGAAAQTAYHGRG